MRAYSAEIYQAAQAASKTLGTLSQPASALKRLALTYLQLGSNATADNQTEVQVKRTTAAGTSTSVTPTQHDAADGTASAVVGQAHTVEPTYSGGAVLTAFFHQRSTFQWYAAPGHEIVIPVTNNAGLGVFCNVITAAFNMGGVLEWEE